MINLFGKELNLEEMFVGALIQFPFYFIIGWWVLLLMPVSGVLWALGGAEKSSKAYRRWGVATVSSVSVLVTNPAWWAVLAFIPAGWGVLTLGYGIPDKTDKGSFLGRFYLGQLKNEKLANFATRLTTYILYWVSFALVGKVLSVMNLIPVF